MSNQNESPNQRYNKTSVKGSGRKKAVSSNRNQTQTSLPRIESRDSRQAVLNSRNAEDNDYSGTAMSLGHNQKFTSGLRSS